jgi:dipeptidyl aminopeptidase/acylaminoacyl peptidase
MRNWIVFLLAGVCAGQTPTFEQSLSLRSAFGPRISPDGRFVAYQVSRTLWDDNRSQTDIWVAVTATGERYRLTGGNKLSGSPEWAPDSKRIAFASERDGKRQIYLISPTGGEAIQLTNLESGAGEFHWLPDGSAIILSASEPEGKALKDRKEKLGLFEVVKGDYTMTHLWKVKVPPATADSGDGAIPKPERLTEGDMFTVKGFSVSPDGRFVAYSAARDPDLSTPDSTINVLTIADKYVRKLPVAKGPNGNPVWSPDGKQVAYTTANGREFFFYTNPLIAVIGVEGGSPRMVTADFDEEPDLLAWGPDGIYFAALQRTSSHLFRVDPLTLAIRRLSAPDRAVVYGATFANDFSQAAFSGSLDGGYTEIYSTPLAAFEPKRLSDMRAQLKDFKLATREVIQWKSTDGTPIEGVLLKPADYDPGRKYPLLVVIHGGPTGIDMPVVSGDRIYPVEKFAAKGALILRPNYRGSAGYGEKFRSLNVRNLGVGDYQDVISGVDFLIAKGMVDRDRVGAMGWSQGGYISAFITTFSDRFKAVSVGAGISNWMTYYVNTDIHPFTRQYLKATPWEDPEIYRKTSPMTYILKARTPTLIQHGELDKRVPIPNAYELRQGLEDRGVPVKMIVYKGFGHGISKPKEQRAAMEHNFEFFSEWIWDEKPASK